ncbi:hypothetical protein ATZ33_00270 [Enterococcus silesiacus]|nr:hypothetical protein [Enterococcus silesiacus]ALR99869.1 hypothetical protein ATZ33_00270 [Enterococcus silesiacus]
MKKKVFWVNKNNLKFVIIIALLLLFIVFINHYSKDDTILYSLHSFINSQKEIILIGLSGAFLFQLVVSCNRLVITENDFIYATLFTKKIFAKSGYKIVGVGAKESYSPGYGDESGNTEYWHQLNVVNKESVQIFEIKVKSSNKYYQEIVSYLKMDELDDQCPVKNIEGCSFVPTGLDRYSKPWLDNLMALVIGAVITFLLYKLVPVRLLETKWQIVVVLAVFFFVGLRNISFKKRIPLQKLSINKESVSINNVHYKNQEIIRLAMSASSDDSKKNNVHFLNIVFEDGSKKQRLFYQFSIDHTQALEYQELEELLLKKFGDKYQLLFSKN